MRWCFHCWRLPPGGRPCIGSRRGGGTNATQAREDPSELRVAPKSNVGQGFEAATFAGTIRARTAAMTDSYDFIAIGAGPAGESAAELASFFGHRSAIVENDHPG